MKKWIKTALLSVGAAALMCGGAFAADASTSGVYDVKRRSTEKKHSFMPMQCGLN